MSHLPAQPSTDAFIERIVREVIRRLLAMEPQQRGGHAQRQSGTGFGTAFSAPIATAPHTISDKLITAATLETIPLGTNEIMIPNRAVVTPLARDEAKSKGIRLVRSESSRLTTASQLTPEIRR
jgi:hypothetical protein